MRLTIETALMTLSFSLALCAYVTSFRALSLSYRANAITTNLGAALAESLLKAAPAPAPPVDDAAVNEAQAAAIRAERPGMADPLAFLEIQRW